MNLDIDGTGPNKKSSSGKAEHYTVFHPRTGRRYFLWLPKSLVKKVGFGRIKIPNWLWNKKKSTVLIEHSVS